MDSLAVWRLVRGQLRAHRAQLRFCLRTTVAGLLALAVVDCFNFPLHGLWTVLTAIVVTETSVGGSLRSARSAGRFTLRRSASLFATIRRLRRRSRACRRSAGACGGDESELPRGAVFGRARAPDRKSNRRNPDRLRVDACWRSPSAGKPVMNECGLETSRFRLAANWRIAEAIPAR